MLVDELRVAHASQPSTIASCSAFSVTIISWIRTAEYPSKCGVVKKAVGFAARMASFSFRSDTRTACEVARRASQGALERRS